MAATAGRRRSLFLSLLENAWITIILSILFASHGYCQTTKALVSENLMDYSSNCREIFTDVRFNRSEIPVSPLSETDAGQLCPKGITCCTKSMEKELTVLSMKEYQTLMLKAIEPIRTTFTSRTNKFDEFFKKLLKKSYNELHVMFVTTYGLLYQQNSRVFSELFTNLTEYYKGRDVDLEKALRSFFINLLKKMFQLLNLAYKLDEPYLECVGSKMDKFKPFEDIPKKLATQVKRAFIAARTFVQGLTIGRDFINTIAKLNPSKECIESVARMIYCPPCQGKKAKKPCGEYCFGTIRACQPYDKELNDAWNQYINALKMVARRLDGPFNIESVVDPINVKISDAIMTYQNKAEFVSAKVFSECGHPSLRQKRDASEMTYQKYDYEWPSAKKSHVRPTTAAGTSLDRLVRDINEKVKIATDYWMNIPRFVCRDEKLAVEGAVDEKLEDQLYNNTDFTVNPVADCWSPPTMESHENGMQKDEMGKPSDLDSERTHTIVLQQVHQLKSMTTKLHNAYKGLYVESIPVVNGSFKVNEKKGRSSRRLLRRLYGEEDGDEEEKGEEDDEMEDEADDDSMSSEDSSRENEDFDGSGDSSGVNDDDDDEDYSSGSGSGDTSREYSVPKTGDSGTSDPKSTGNYYFVTESTPVPTRQSPNDVRGESSASRLLRPSAIGFSLVVACLLIV